MHAKILQPHTFPSDNRKAAFSFLAKILFAMFFDETAINIPRPLVIGAAPHSLSDDDDDAESSPIAAAKAAVSRFSPFSSASSASFFSRA